MNTGLAILALRDSGVSLRGGDAVHCMWAHRVVWEDPPVMEVVRREARATVLTTLLEAGIDTARVEDVIVVEFSPAELEAAETRHRMMVDPGYPSEAPSDLYAVVAYWLNPATPRSAA